MADDGRVVTAKLPDELVSRMDEIAGRIERSKSWIVRQAVSEWLAEEQRRYELTLEALRDVDEGRTLVQLRASSELVRSCCPVPFCPAVTMATITTLIVVALVLVEAIDSRRATSS